jgi:predicted metalloprotease with PDZ domain
MRTVLRRGPFAALLLIALQFAAFAQAPPKLDYTMGITNAAAHLFHIKIAISNVSGGTLDLALPAWTPGWYTIRPYMANVVKLQAHDGQGKRLPLRAVDKQTYRIETTGLKAFTVEYDYFANNPAVNGAELTEKRGYFLGTNLFFYVPGHTTDSPSQIKFEIPAGWRVATGLKRASEPNTYLARNFDNLVDCPTILGDFDEEMTTAAGKPIHVVIDPKGLYTPEKLKKLAEGVSRIINSQAAMFGGLPYEEYWVLYVGGETVRGGGALEHENSTNVMVGRLPDDPAGLFGVTSHEHFHVWNVKRIKPAGLMPYDYSREQYIRELWFAEGVTSYFSDVHLLRSGAWTPETFLQQQAGQISNLQGNEARNWISLDDSSITTWLTYGGGGTTANFGVNYYNKGQIIGLLLDLEIRGATAGRKTFDDVLRQMFEDYYKRGRGYTVEDVEKTVAEVAGRSFKDFFARYVHGTAELDYNAALAHVGLKLEDNPATAGANEVARRFNRYRIVEIEGASEAQKSLRRAWLGGAAKAQGAK